MTLRLEIPPVGQHNNHSHSQNHRTSKQPPTTTHVHLPSNRRPSAWSAHFFAPFRNKNAMLQRNQRLNSFVGFSHSMHRLFINWKHNQLVTSTKIQDGGIFSCGTPKIEGHVPLKMEWNPPMPGGLLHPSKVFKFVSTLNIIPPKGVSCHLFFSSKHIQSN